MEGHLSEENQL